MGEMQTITSRQNTRLKTALALKGRKGRRDQCRFLAEGLRLLSETKEALEQLLELWLAAEKTDLPEYRSWIETASQLGIPVFVLPQPLFAELADTETSQGIVGVLRLPLHDLDRFMGSGRYVGLLADGIQDPGNLGTMIRTAEAMGFSFVLIPPGTTDPYSEKCVRASMGSIFHIPVVLTDDLLRDIHLLKEARYEMAGALLENSTASHEASFGSRLLLAVGSEGAGITAAVREQLDYAVRIPMTGRVESLNASAALAMLAYEIQRQALQNAVE